jgi:SAM-dependent methyltransferase
MVTGTLPVPVFWVSMELSEIQIRLAELAGEKALLEGPNLERRTEAIEDLEVILEILDKGYRKGTVGELIRQAEALRKRLAAVSEGFFARLREQIRSGELSAAGLRDILNRYTRYPPTHQSWLHGSYESLDVLVSGLLLSEPAPQETRERTDEMIQYQASPGSVVLDLVDRVDFAPDDVFYDLGSGLGQVPILVNLLTGVRAVGVEYQPSYCAYARQRAASLGLPEVVFINQDVREVDLSTGTVFYLFTPFIGSILEAVLERLREVAQHHGIRICSYGATTPQLAQQAWVKCLDENAAQEFKLCVFVSTFLFSATRGLVFRPLTARDVGEVLQWAYDPPYQIYNLGKGDPTAVFETFLDPENAYYGIFDRKDELVAYCCFGSDAQVPGGNYASPALDIGLSLLPDLTGQGRGLGYVEAVLDFAAGKLPGSVFRVTIAGFNQRAQKVWRKAGFVTVQRFLRNLDQMPFVVMKHTK